MRYSHSQLQVYATCPTKYKLHYVDQLSPKQVTDEHDLRFGRAFHAALAVLYSPDPDIERAEYAFATAYPESEYPVVLPNWSQGKSFQGGLAALAAYVAHWDEEDRNWEVLSVEQSYVDESERDRLVRQDLIVRDRRDGLVYGVDHKVTGKYLDKDYWPQFDPHSQIRQYVKSLQQQYPQQVGGFYINAISCKHRSKAYSPSRGPNKGVSLPAGDWSDFKRMVFNPNQEAIEAETENLRAWIGRIEADKLTGIWGYNTDQCVRGPFVCEFHAICSRGYQWPRDAELILSDYRQQCLRLDANGDRCQLEPHEGDKHDGTRPVREDAEVDLSEIAEEAEQ